jgi:hypothetical protein
LLASDAIRRIGLEEEGFQENPVVLNDQLSQRSVRRMHQKEEGNLKTMQWDSQTLCRTPQIPSSTPPAREKTEETETKRRQKRQVGLMRQDWPWRSAGQG